MYISMYYDYDYQNIVDTSCVRYYPVIALKVKSISYYMSLYHRPIWFLSTSHTAPHIGQRQGQWKGQLGAQDYEETVKKEGGCLA